MRQIVELERALSAVTRLAEAAEAERDELRKRIGNLDNIVSIQCTDGNWNYDPYMHGMANGLLVAQAAMHDSNFTGLDAPEKWIDSKDNPMNAHTIRSKPEVRCVICDDHLFTATRPRGVYAGTNPDGSGRLAHPHCWANMRDQLWLSFGVDLDALSERELDARRASRPKLGTPPVFVGDGYEEEPAP